jgi:FkbM family methyltransferase
MPSKLEEGGAHPPVSGTGRHGAALRGQVVRALKAVRASQPFNAVATTTVRAVLTLAGMRSAWVVKHLHRVGTVRCRLPNGRLLRLRSRGDDWVSNQVFWLGWRGYEPETTPLFYRLAARARATLDVGAHVGFFALLAGHANPAGKVYAFEPMPAIYERLQRHVALNGLGNVACFASAVGDHDGSADFFHLAGARLPCSSSLSLAFMSWTDDVCSTRVPVLTLDRFVGDRGIDRVDLVKIDTESTEPAVLAGMRETLRRDRPFLVCEVLPGRGSERPLEELLGPLGYRFYLLTPDGPAHREKVQGHPVWLNYLFAPLDPAGVAEL